jgi:phospholipid transport system substrate-binding protein
LDIVYDYVDFREMAMRTLGPNWKKQAPAKQSEFVKSFEKLLFEAYIDRIDSYTCLDEKVAYDGEKIKGEYALVNTRVIVHRNQEIAVQYRMKLKEADWMVYDIVVQGVSLVNTFRSQFSSILNRSSFDQLLAQMQQKTALNK